MNPSIEEMNRFLDLVKKPDETRPWIEFRYTGYKSIGDFLNVIRIFENAPALIESQKPVFFRGQADANWTLESKLYRLTKNLGLEDALHREYESFHYFKERAHLFLKAEHLPNNDDWPEWLSLMQHFSVPTRFLDWTTSIQIALYFASENIEPCVDGAVWLLWQGDFFSSQGDVPKLDDSIRKEIFGDAEKFAQFGLSCKPYFEGYDANRKNERMLAQRALHIWSWRLFTDLAMDIGHILLHSLTATPPSPKMPLMKLVIPQQFKEEIRVYLHQLNVTAEFLFPGLDGIGRSITETITYQQAIFRKGESPQEK
jgi:hypothetical protein